MKAIKLIEVRSEIGAGTRGASLGIDALKVAALNKESDFFKVLKSEEVPDDNHLLLETDGNPFAKRIRGIVAVYERLSASVMNCLNDGKYPIVLSGDHSCAGGTVAGIKMAFPEKRLGVIWLDAHADLHSPYTTPSGNVHGMPLAIALAEDNLECKLNDPDQETIEDWEKLKKIGNITPKIEPKDLVFISLRDSESQEDHLINKNNIKSISVEDVRRQSPESTSAGILEYLDHCDLIYISFDVDCIDPAVSAGTGTPVKDGLTNKEAGELMNNLVQSPKVCCLEVSEINPTLDNKNVMAEYAFKVLSDATNMISNN